MNHHSIVKLDTATVEVTGLLVITANDTTRRGGRVQVQLSPESAGKLAEALTRYSRGGTKATAEPGSASTVVRGRALVVGVRL